MWVNIFLAELFNLFLCDNYIKAILVINIKIDINIKRE